MLFVGYMAQEPGYVAIVGLWLLASCSVAQSNTSEQMQAALSKGPLLIVNQLNRYRSKLLKVNEATWDQISSLLDILFTVVPFPGAGGVQEGRAPECRTAGWWWWWWWAK